jgi:hypothetical protein
MTVELSNPASQDYDLYSPFQYPSMCLNFFLAFWLVSNLFHKALLNTNHYDIKYNFEALDGLKKRNVITYIMQLIVTTTAFILQIWGGTDILFRLEDTTSEAKLNAMVLAMLLIAVLYIWELCYREQIGWPLLTHHLVTLLLIQTSTAAFFDTQYFVYVRFAMLLGFHATTEQISFLALFCFRVNIFPKWQGIIFYAAAAQSFLLKTIVTICAFLLCCIDIYARDALEDPTTNWKWFWKIFFLPLLVLLYGSQVYACKILYSLGTRCKQSNALLEKANSETIAESVDESSKDHEDEDLVLEV